jgi:hypothetical protein
MQFPGGAIDVKRRPVFHWFAVNAGGNPYFLLSGGIGTSHALEIFGQVADVGQICEDSLGLRLDAAGTLIVSHLLLLFAQTTFFPWIGSK